VTCCEVESHDRKKAVPHEGTKERVIDEHRVPSGDIGRMRSATLEVYGFARNSMITEIDNWLPTLDAFRTFTEVRLTQ
jgi:hypothetical protein